jgi:hypothetical protein
MKSHDERILVIRDMTSPRRMHALVWRNARNHNPV